MIHSAIFIEIDDSFIDYNYILLWTLTPLYLGLFFYRKPWKKRINPPANEKKFE